MIKSTGEPLIRKILKQNSINFKEQYRFSDCRSILPLPFDFAVFDKNDNLILLIEFDGRQHYVEYDNTYYDSLDHIQLHDKIKTDYCLSHKLELLRISYKEKHNLKNIILNRINNLLNGGL
jgi:hypothetical protein